ncbi:pyrroline-5-carboxylate reductase [Agrobacterium sp. NPDC090273]|uniref:pyrroline-5-carboxylate reductase n=1 Tax=Agrobacterium sp. NPDC090273 TaxID=3363919 RepID=UPI00383A1667
MANPINIVLAGCGNMGYAMLKGWLARDGMTPDCVHVVEPVEPLRKRAAETGARVYESADALEASLKPDVIFLAVKPQVMTAVLPAYRRFVGSSVFVSIAAGVGVRTLEASLGDCAVIRAMPNTPASIGHGMTVTFANDGVDEDQAQLVQGLLSGMGKVLAVSSEEQVDAATAISGSGPAYIFYFIECLAKAGEAVGLDADQALLLARQTVHGAAAMASSRNDGPDVLRREVTSPNGTTAAALDILMGEGAFMPLIGEAAKAAHDRAIELSKTN